MKIQLKFFSTLKERFKSDGRQIEVFGEKSAQEIFETIFEDSELAKRFLPSTRFAINCEYVSSDAILKDGDELAFIPPVSGG
ncbi:MAG: MoaD/ThiS family protein [Deltaproteobacteria bacterium]|nr:MoaD/ThiS family protein [Deltaproteobacteria bacterium]